MKKSGQLIGRKYGNKNYAGGAEADLELSQYVTVMSGRSCSFPVAPLSVFSGVKYKGV